MNRTNYLLLAGIVLLLVGAGVAGQLQFRSTHPAASGVAQVPGGAGQEPGGLPPGHPPTPATGPQAGPGVSEPLSLTDLDQGPGPNDGKPFPATLNGMPRTSHTTGAAALTQIGQLHGKEIRAAAGEIATYTAGQEKVTIWVTNSATKEEAQALFQQMLDRLAQAGAYTKPEVLSIKNRAYFSSRGNGAQNYFYLRGSRIYWAALEVPTDKLMGVMSFIVNQL